MTDRLPLPSHDGYEVASDGRLWRLPRTIVTVRGPRRVPGGEVVGNLSPGMAYRRVGVDGQVFYLHSLVALAFHGPCPSGMEVRHLDGDPLNNAAANLAYGTSSQNKSDTVSHGRHHQAVKTHCPQNHPYDEANTQVRDGRRFCLECKRTRGRETARRRRAAAVAS